LDNLNATVRDTFPAAAVHTPTSTGAPQLVTVVHDYRWLEVSGAGDAAQSAQVHTAFVRLADFATQPAQGDALTISTGNGAGPYQVNDVQADGGGGAMLILGRA
jgi:hypothetical protein